MSTLIIYPKHGHIPEKELAAVKAFCEWQGIDCVVSEERNEHGYPSYRFDGRLLAVSFFSLIKMLKEDGAISDYAGQPAKELPAPEKPLE